jgi:hypothetical protein
MTIARTRTSTLNNNPALNGRNGKTSHPDTNIKKAGAPTNKQI